MSIVALLDGFERKANGFLIEVEWDEHGFLKWICAV
jgi:hypothetical protein